MKNEAEIENIPVNEEAIEFDDESLAKGFSDDNPTVEDTTETIEEEVSTPTETESEEKEVDFTPFLEKLSQNVKYMDQEIKIENLDDVIKNYQKGLDYDRKLEKLNELEKSEELTYIKEKSKEFGMTPSEYIKAVKEYEVKQQKEKEQQEINEMIENGVAEDIAKKVIETNRIATDLQEEKLRIRQEKEQAELQAKKNAENDQFLSAYPEIKVSEIPKEVFVEAEKVGLLNAYRNYENQQLKKQLEILKQNQNNAKTSPIQGTTEHGGVVVEKEDPFAAGFNSD